MKRINISGDNWKESVLSEALSVLKAGGIVMHPTETCYGLAVDIFNEDALQKLYKLKKMDTLKPVSIIVASIEDAKKWAEIDEKAEDLMKEFWPGPYTFLVKRRDTLPMFFNKGMPKVGLRNPSVPSIIKMVETFGRPVTTTSANVSGRPESYDASEFLGQLKGLSNSFKPDLIIDAGFIGENKPSTIYDVVDNVCLRGSMDL
jgi:L-threonylcarbamoyladenylate synthase